ncbi:IclR family transcriptional regulator C-terminal domain-containing protein [Novosphingobium sp. BL-52-GroH]|uniref:IclR family transcriptional regulator domain-containing protein n=1 Tax=Novosphingobium sp. BL-52-GroH TaxID=3349877 RepID=UPI00384EBE43
MAHANADELVETDGASELAGEKKKTVRDVDRMGGFAKGLAVIEAFGKGRDRLTIAEVARLSGLDRASARRCLLTLVEQDYAVADDRYFELTPRILKLGQSYLSASLPQLLRPALSQLAGRIGESCSAAVLDHTEVVYIARATQHHIVGTGLHPGSRLPAYCTSLGRVLLAALSPDAARKRIEASVRQPLTGHTLTSVKDIMAELTRVREQGYSIIDQEVAPNSLSIGIPVINSTGSTVAAINVGLHASRGTKERMIDDILPALLDVKRYLAETLP